MHVAELRRMGARIDVSGNTAAVEGVPALSGAPAHGDRPSCLGFAGAGGTGGVGDDRGAPDLPPRRGYEALERRLSSWARTSPGEGIGGGTHAMAPVGNGGIPGGARKGGDPRFRRRGEGVCRGRGNSPIGREDGDVALAEYTRRFDRFDPAGRALPFRRGDRRGMATRSDGVAAVPRAGAERIEAFHRRQVEGGFGLSHAGRPSVKRVLPVARAACMCPGGRRRIRRPC